MRIKEHLLNLISQPGNRANLLFNDNGSIVLSHCFGVVILVIVSCMRQRNKDGWHTADCGLSHSHGAASGNHHVTTGIELRHCIAEAKHISIDRCPTVSRADRLDTILAGDVGHFKLEPLCLQQPACGGEVVVKKCSSL